MNIEETRIEDNSVFEDQRSYIQEIKTTQHDIIVEEIEEEDKEESESYQKH